jgi:hypothetical protein
MSMNKKPTIGSRTLQLTKIVAAIGQYVTAAIVLGGKSTTPKALTAVFQAVLDAEQDLVAARLVVADKLQARAAALAQASAILPGLIHAIAATYGEGSTPYVAFGFPTRKTPQRSAAGVAAAVTKGSATRAAHAAALAASTAPASPVTAVVASPAKA